LLERGKVNWGWGISGEARRPRTERPKAGWCSWEGAASCLPTS